MKLYHYASSSKGVFDKVRTERNQLATNGVHVKDKYPSYYDQVSFFFSKPPLSQIAKLYMGNGYEHPFWYSGHVLNEYVVDLSNQNLHQFMFNITETPEKTALFYDQSVTDEEYPTQLDRMEKSKGYTGESVAAMEVSILKLVDRLGDNFMLNFYVELMNKDNFDDIKDKYAPTVPHVMVYDKAGEFDILEVKTVIVE